MSRDCLECIVNRLSLKLGTSLGTKQHPRLLAAVLLDVTVEDFTSFLGDKYLSAHCLSFSFDVLEVLAVVLAEFESQ